MSIEITPNTSSYSRYFDDKNTEVTQVSESQKSLNLNFRSFIVIMEVMIQILKKSVQKRAKLPEEFQVLNLAKHQKRSTLNNLKLFIDHIKIPDKASFMNQRITDFLEEKLYKQTRQQFNSAIANLATTLNISEDSVKKLRYSKLLELNKKLEKSIISDNNKKVALTINTRQYLSEFIRLERMIETYLNIFSSNSPS